MLLSLKSRQPRSAVIREAGSTQRATGDRRRLHHPARTRIRVWAGGHRHRIPAAHADRDPDGQPRPPLPDHLRQRRRPCAASGAHPPHRIRRPTNRVAREGSRLYPPRLYRGRGSLPSSPRCGGLGRQRPNQRRRPHPGLPQRQPRGQTRRLAHPKTYRQRAPARRSPWSRAVSRPDKGVHPGVTPARGRTTPARRGQACRARGRVVRRACLRAGVATHQAWGERCRIARNGTRM